MKVNMIMDQRGEPEADLGRDCQAAALQLIDSRVHVEGIPGNYCVDRHAQRAKLILHAVAVGVADLAQAAEEQRHPVAVVHHP